MSNPVPQPTLDDQADIGILTVIPAELDAALKALPKLVRKKVQSSGTVYWTGTIPSQLTGHDYRVVVSCIGEAGNPSSAAAAMELLSTYKPRALLLMGIAAGMRGKIKIGNVVFSERVVAYEPAALAKAEDGSVRIEHRPEIDRAPHTIMQDVTNYLRASSRKRLEEAFREMRGTFPAAPEGREDEYTKHVAAEINARLSTIGSGEKLLRNPEELKALREDLHGKLEVAAMEEVGIVSTARQLNIPWLVIRGISDFGDELKDDRFHAFASEAAATVLIDFITHGLDVGPPTPPPGWQAAQGVSKDWLEETRDVIGKDVRIPRDDLKQQVLHAIEEHPVTVLLGDSGSGKSALVKALHRAGVLPEVTLCLHAQEVAALVNSHDLHTALKAQRKGVRLLFVLDGLEQIAGTPNMRLTARALRALGLSSTGSPWKLILTCQSAPWERVRQELASLDISLEDAKYVSVDRFTEAEVKQVAAEVKSIAPVLLREDLRPVMGRPKVLDLIAHAAADIGLPDVSRWVGESSLIEWVWNGFICGDGRGDQHARLLQDLAARQADERLFAIPITELTTPDTELLADLARLGILTRKHGAVRFAHDLYADYARQRFLLAFIFSQRPGELKSRVGNPLWHRAMRFVGLHMLEYRDRETVPDIEAWRRLVRTLDERRNTGGLKTDADDDDRSDDDARPGAGVDLLLEGIAFAAQPGPLLNSIRDDLVEHRGALLRSFFFRFRHAALQWVPIGDIFKRPQGEISPEQRKALEQLIILPDYLVWEPVIEWTSQHAVEVLSYAPDEFVDAAEFWLTTTKVIFSEKLLNIPQAQLLASTVLDLAERAANTDDHYSEHSRTAKHRVRVYKMLLLCGPHERDRALEIIRRLCGLIDTPPSVISRPPRRSVLPPEYYPSVPKPPYWPNGPKSEPSVQFRQAALTKPGAGWLVALDPNLAREVFLALLIEVPDRDRDRGDLYNFREGFHYDAWHYVRPPFWDFAPAQALFGKDHMVAADFVLQVTDFATSRWAERWPHVPHAGSLFGEVPGNVPNVTLTIDGIDREYVGDARVLEWHQGGSQGPDVVAAALMSLEHWLYQQDEKNALDDAFLNALFSKSKSVAVLGVLLELVRKNPNHLLGPLEPLLQCAEMYLWTRTNYISPQTAMIAWMGQPGDRAKAAYDWHSMSHRKPDLLYVVTSIWLRRLFGWPALDAVRERWRASLGHITDERLRTWIHDVMLCNLDRNNWRLTTQPDGRQIIEYVHPEHIERRQAAVC